MHRLPSDTIRKYPKPYDTNTKKEIQIHKYRIQKYKQNKSGNTYTLQTCTRMHTAHSNTIQKYLKPFLMKPMARSRFPCHPCEPRSPRSPGNPDHKSHPAVDGCSLPRQESHQGNTCSECCLLLKRRTMGCKSSLKILQATLK